MLNQSPVVVTIPVVDADRAKAFYQDTLGLALTDGLVMGGMMFQAGNGTKVYLYPREASKADHTLASFEVTDIEEDVADLVAQGVEFIEYKDGPIKTENFISTIEGQKAAWFKDSEGNILSLNQAVQE